MIRRFRGGESPFDTILQSLESMWFESHFSFQEENIILSFSEWSHCWFGWQVRFDEIPSKAWVKCFSNDMASLTTLMLLNALWVNKTPYRTELFPSTVFNVTSFSLYVSYSKNDWLADNKDLFDKSQFCFSNVIPTLDKELHKMF